MTYVVKQLQLLWSLKMIRILFEQLFAYNDHQVALSTQNRNTLPTKSKLQNGVELDAFNRVHLLVVLSFSPSPSPVEEGIVEIIWYCTFHCKNVSFFMTSHHTSL